MTEILKLRLINIRFIYWIFGDWNLFGNWDLVIGI
jgi:hypothetical protein